MKVGALEHTADTPLLTNNVDALHTHTRTWAWLSAPAGVPVSLLLESIKFAHFYRAFQGSYIGMRGLGDARGGWSVNNESYINQTSFFSPSLSFFSSR